MRIMKIDFNENGMTINFDKVPKFLYFNEEARGCGQVFLDGVRTKLLQDIRIHAHTVDENGRHPLQYSITYGEKGPSGFSSKTMSSNMKNELRVGIKVLDLEEFKGFIACVKEIMEDERIPEGIRQECAKKITTSFSPYYEETTKEGAPND